MILSSILSQEGNKIALCNNYNFTIEIQNNFHIWSEEMNTKYVDIQNNNSTFIYNNLF